MITFYYRLTDPYHKGKIVRNIDGKTEIFNLYGWKSFDMRPYFDYDGLYANECEHISKKDIEKEKAKYIVQTLANLKLAKDYCPNSKLAKCVEEPELKIIAFLYESKKDIALLRPKFPSYVINSVNALKRKRNEPTSSHIERIKTNDEALIIRMAYELQKRKSKSNRHI